MTNARDAFYPKKLNDNQIKKCDYIREAYSILAGMLKDIIPSGRESSLAMTKLEESSMWAIKAISNGNFVDIDEEIPEGEVMGEPYNDI